MVSDHNRVLMISPFKHSQRGNSITSLRIKTGLEKRGYNIDLISLEDQQASLQIKRKLVEHGYSLFHAFHARYLGKVLEDIPALQALPILLTTTGTDLHVDLPNQDPLVQKGLLAAQKIVLFHQDFKPLISRPYPQLRSRLTVIPQGIYLQNVSRETFLMVDFQPDDFVFYFPSGLRPIKNFELVLNGLEKIKPDYPQLKLVIIGAVIDPHYSREVLARIKALPWITYLGEIPNTEVSSVIHHCHAVINSSHFEGQPQGALEAMQLGLPAILTAVPGNLGIIKDGREGYYVSNEAEFAQAARNLMDHPSRAKAMGAAARQLTEKNFSLLRELQAYDDLYRQLID